MKNTIAAIFLLCITTLSHASWNTVRVDQHRDKAFAVSPWASAEKTQAPLDALTAVLGVGCQADGHRWVYVKLSESIQNLQPALTSKAVSGKFTWENNTSYEAPFLYYNDAKTLFLKAGVDDAIKILRNGNLVSLSITWGDSHSTTFSFELTGSRKAVSDAFADCEQSNT